ncbi:Hypp4562 [Branchiostoma lanceolatum]|uniref:Hypp4562 protein n=1 Tax=Branchiostoma lanceolatum TaxID=7740 RepID=A0A8K0A872_BRALA|nr:Hypp4562 [Branchiostoma lanceolatum]
MGQRCSCSRPKKARLPDVDGTNFRQYTFPFENLVLEGGGAKGAAYVGALKILEDAGILQNIKRFGGTSAGSITAGFLAVGMTPQDILDKMNQDLQKILLGGSPSPCCLCCYFNNLENHYGIFPAEKFLDWYGKAIEEHLQKRRRQISGHENPHKFDNLSGDITFAQVYHALGKELCTVSYETAFSSEVYSHVKTSPLLEIREAVRMSMSIPVVFEAYEPSVGLQPGVRHVDGGMSANYPIYCFEGWWLSMHPENTFAKRLGALNGRNLKKNFLPGVSREHFHSGGNEDREKTLGACLFSDTGELDKFQHQFEDRMEAFLVDFPQYKRILKKPNTKLANEYRQKMERLQVDRDKFLKKLDDDSRLEEKIMQVAALYPNKAEMNRRFDTLFSAPEIIQIYGEPDKDAAFEMLFLNYNKEPVEPTKSVAVGIYQNQKHLQKAKNECLKGSFADTSVEFYGQLMEFIRKNKPMEEYDVGRSIGINVDYIGSLDFDLETGDKEFLMTQGAVATKAFLHDWVRKHVHPPV